MSSPLMRRGKALEDEFFRKEELKKVAQRQAQQRQEASKTALRAASGITEDEVLDQLLALGIDGDTVAALSLVPLVLVAWADHDVHDREREAIMKAAQGAGIEPDAPAHGLLAAWLKTKPEPELMKAWVAYVDALHEQLPEEQLQVVRRQVIGRARDVAAAAGGILGIGKVSASEAAVLAEIDAAFDRRPQTE